MKIRINLLISEKKKTQLWFDRDYVASVDQYEENSLLFKKKFFFLTYLFGCTGSFSCGMRNLHGGMGDELLVAACRI